MSDTQEMPVVRVDAPPSIPFPYGLLSLTPSPLPEGWEAGASWESEACGVVLSTTGPCQDNPPPTIPPLLQTLGCSVASAAPFVVYSYGQLSTFSRARTLAARRERARTALLAGEQTGAEKGLWAQFVAANPTPMAVVWDASAKQTIRNAIALMEAAFAASYGGTPVIHLPRYCASLVADEMNTRGNVMLTPLGSQVVAGGGYGPTITADPASATAYVTGPIVIARGEVQTANAIDTNINSLSGLAQRLYVTGWDCGVLAVTIDLEAT